MNRETFARLGVPQPDGVLARASDPPAVCRKRHVVDVVLMTVEYKQLLPAGDIPEPHGPIARTTDNSRSLRTEVDAGGPVFVTIEHHIGRLVNNVD